MSGPVSKVTAQGRLIVAVPYLWLGLFFLVGCFFYKENNARLEQEAADRAAADKAAQDAAAAAAAEKAAQDAAAHDYVAPRHKVQHFAKNPDAPGHIPMGLISEQISEGVKTYTTILDVDPADDEMGSADAYYGGHDD